MQITIDGQHDLFDHLPAFAETALDGIDYIVCCYTGMSDFEPMPSRPRGWYLQDPEGAMEHSKKMKAAWERGCYTEERNQKIREWRTGYRNAPASFAKGWETRRNATKQSSTQPTEQ